MPSTITLNDHTFSVSGPIESYLYICIMGAKVGGTVGATIGIALGTTLAIASPLILGGAIWYAVRPTPSK